jgi:hypothetical protein
MLWKINGDLRAAIEKHLASSKNPELRQLQILNAFMQQPDIRKALRFLGHDSDARELRAQAFVVKRIKEATLELNTNSSSRNSMRFARSDICRKTCQFLMTTLAPTGPDARGVSCLQVARTIGVKSRRGLLSGGGRRKIMSMAVKSVGAEGEAIGQRLEGRYFHAKRRVGVPSLRKISLERLAENWWIDNTRRTGNTKNMSVHKEGNLRETHPTHYLEDSVPSFHNRFFQKYQLRHPLKVLTWFLVNTPTRAFARTRVCGVPALVLVCMMQRITI